jgi:hypothetical protein
MANHFRLKPRFIAFVVIFAVLLIGMLGLFNWAAIGSKMATPMRKLLGVERVAQLETLFFDIQDAINQKKYDLGLAEPENPWGDSQNPAVVSILPSLTLPPPLPSATPLPIQSSDSSPDQPTPTSSLSAATATPAPTPTPAVWTLPDIRPLGDLAGEGVWQPYITNPAGEVVAYRTFLQPDPERPYALAAVAAFDLTKTNLHYILGSVEPAKPGGPHGTGLIPAEDKQPGKLLAAFNGGFIAEHGAYGAMSGGIIPLSAKPGLATLAIYPDGAVRIGEWGVDILEEDEYSAWRQNAILIIQNGVINPKVYTGTWKDWGANYDFNAVTLRSSIGLSQDGKVLYYFAGPSLLMPPLAEAMEASGVYNGMLLDINPTHAHFTAIRLADGKMVAEPLFKEEMNVWVDRYIRPWPYEQDFFYVTAKD